MQSPSPKIPLFTTKPAVVVFITQSKSDLDREILKWFAVVVKKKGYSPDLIFVPGVYQSKRVSSRTGNS